jgi:GntR family transcriptional regulator, galactonate operon transcriptional repressor
MASLHREMMDVLLGEITSGAVDEGAQLPTLSELADEFHVSTAVARECQRALEERGLVWVRHGRRAVVRGRDEWDVLDPDVLAAILRDSAGSTLVLGEYLETRRILEVEAAGLSAERASPAGLGELSRAFDNLVAFARRARSSPAAEPLYRQTDVDFHRAIVRTAGNRPLARMAEPIHRALSTTFGELARPDVRLERSLPEHELIWHAIRDRDPDAARCAMRDHLLTVEGYLRERAATQLL